MSNKLKTTTKQKQPKTIKVKTLIIALVIATALGASFVGGMYWQRSYDHNVKTEAMVQANEIVKLKPSSNNK